MAGKHAPHKKQLSVWVAADLIALAKGLAADAGMSLAELVESLLRLYTREHAKERRGQ